MSKPEMKGDKGLLIACIGTAERDGPRRSLSELWQTVAPLYNATLPSGYPEITPSVVMLRVTSWGIPVKTVPGRKGRTFTDTERAAVAERFKGTRGKRKGKPLPATMDVALLRRRTPAALQPLIDRIIAPRGNLKAAVKLNCLQCCGYARKEVSRCSAFACPLYRFRPYQNGTEEAVETDAELATV